MTTKIFKTENAKLTVYPNGPEWDGVPAAAFGDFSCKTPDAGAEILREVH